MSTPPSVGNADTARESARQDNGQFGTQPLAEGGDLALVGTAQELPAVGSCPDCRAPMGPIIGKDGDVERFMPGAQCPECPYTAAQMELETDPFLDDEGRGYLYALEADGTVRITDDDGSTVELYRPEDGAGWGDELANFGLDAGAVRTALADPYDTARARAVDEGAPVMGEVYDILLNRERIPASFLVGDCTSTDDIEAWNTIYVEPALTELGEKYPLSSGPVDPYAKGSDRTPRQSSMDELRGECEDAGLDSMYDVYAQLAERGQLSDFAAKNMTAEEVRGDYEDYIEPAVDRLEARLESEYRADAAHRRSAPFWAEVEAFTKDDELDPADLRRVSGDLFEDSWQKMSDDNYSDASLRAHADTVEAIGKDLRRPALVAMAGQLRASADTVS